MHSATTQNTSEYRDVPVTALIESSSNPRKRFDETSLGEMAASFKTQGILALLLVRELDESNYEVIAGARRLRAAKLAELENVPVRVIKLSDAEAIEAQLSQPLWRGPCESSPEKHERLWKPRTTAKWKSSYGVRINP